MSNLIMLFLLLPNVAHSHDTKIISLTIENLKNDDSCVKETKIISELNLIIDNHLNNKYYYNGHSAVAYSYDIKVGYNKYKYKYTTHINMYEIESITFFVNFSNDSNSQKLKPVISEDCKKYWIEKATIIKQLRTIFVSFLLLFIAIYILGTILF